MILFFACGKPAQTATEVPSLQPAEATAPADASEETVLQPETVRLYGQEFPVDVQTLAFSEPIDDPAPLADALTRLADCRSVQVIRSFDPAKTEGGLAAFERDWNALFARFPNVAFSGGLLIGGEPSDTLTVYTVPASAVLSEEIRSVVSLCPALETLDLSETSANSESIAAAEQDAPGVRILWTDATYGASASDAERLSFSGTQDPEALSAYLACFPALSEIDVRDASFSEEDGNALCDRFPAAIRRMVTLNGEAYDSFTESLDLSGAKIDSYEAFSDTLRYFPKLGQLLMHDCSLTNEQLAAIRDRYPDAGVVWTVRFGRWSLATDAVAFSTMQSGYTTYRLQTDDAKVLRYCRDLIALDLGHNDLSDIGWMTELKHLQVLILADNRKLKDISPIGTLSELKYLELFLTGIEDITPLGRLSELLDVNLFITHISDITPLLSCKKLERIWLGEKVAAQIGKEGAAKLQKAFPDAQFDLVSAGATKLGWREHPRYDAIREMFENNTAVDPFLP